MNTKNQEVIIYHAQYIKRLDNLSNLNPSSCILANAIKLTNVEIHSSELYNINVTGNTFLRNIDLQDCVTLGTVTATGSSLDLSNCKYLKHCNVYNTALTEVQLNSSGGSLIDIYYPQTVQSIQLIKQRLLEIIGLPYGNNGNEIPTSLYTIDIQECPSIKYLNTSNNPSINTTFASMRYCNNLTLRNSLDLERLDFDGFYRLQNVTIENMYNLEEIGFNNLLPKGDASTIKYIGMSNCPLLEVIELNCTSDDFEITFADKGLLNFGGLIALKSISSNCILKGLETIVVPRQLESMYFTDDYGEGYSSIVNIWSSSVCNINTAGTSPKAIHVDSTYKGIDFAGMNLKNIDLGALVNIPNAVNFSLSPTTVNPNFNKNRDGETFPYLQPIGTLDLSNYTESLAKFFDGVDLDKLVVICNNNLPQNDLSYCFYNATFSSDTAIDTILSKVSSITNLDYCFYKTTVSDTSILNKVNMGASSSMNYTFAECPNIKTLTNIVIPSNVIEVEGMFNKCPLTSITNMTINVNGSISGLFKGCDQLITIATLRIPNVTDVSSTFEGCTNLTNLTGFTLPDTCTRVDNLFNGCYALSVLSMSFGPNIVSGENWYPPNLTTLNDTEILNSAVKLKDCTTLTDVNNMYIEKGDFNDLFNGCVKLTNLDIILGSEIGSMARMLKNCRKINTLPFTIPSTCTNIDEIFAGTAITDVSGLTFDTRITSATNWYSSSITKANNVTIKNNYVKLNIPTLTECDGLLIYNMNNLDNFLENTAIPRLKGLTIPNTVRSMKCFLKNNTAITVAEIKMPNDVTNISELISGCSLLRDISGTTFASGITNATDWNLGVPLTTLNNVVLNTELVKFTGINTIKYVENFVIGDNVTNIDELFKNCYNLTSDIYIPLHVVSCISAFENCRGLTHAQSNWEQTYNNGITPTNCYAGCTGITHIDDMDLGVNEYIKGLDDIPPAWGGYGFSNATTGIYKFEIPNDNYTLELRNNYNTTSHGLMATGIVDWGDGTVTTMEWVHTYATAGVYIVKMQGLVCTPNYPHTSISNTITEIIKMPYAQFKIGNMFCNCPKLTKANLSNVTGEYYYLFVGSKLEEINVTNATFIGGMSPFHSCSYLKTIIGLDTVDTSQVTNFNYCFRDCVSLETIDCSSFDTSNATNMIGMFWCLTRESTTTQIIGVENFNTSKVTDMTSVFRGQAGLTSLDLSKWKTDNVTTMNGIFWNCKNLTSLNLTGWNTSKTRVFQGMFRDCPLLKNVDISHFDFSNATDVSYLFNGCSSMTDDDIAYHKNFRFPKITTMSSIYSGCSKLTTIDISEWGFPNDGSCEMSSVVSQCTNLTSIKMPSHLKSFSLSSFFAGCTKLEDVGEYTFEVTTYSKANASGAGVSHLFNNCTSLVRVGTVITRGQCRATFSNCHKLASVKEFRWANNINYYDSYLLFQNINGTTELSINFTVGSEGCGPNYFVGASTNNTLNKPNFTRESAVSLLNSLGNFNGPTNSIGSSDSPLAFRSAVRAKLTDADIAIATAKGWTIA